MTDLPPFPACTSQKGHDISVVLPGEDSGDLTFYCCRCGVMRRMPATGPLVGGSLDDLDAEEIREAAMSRLRRPDRG